MNPDAMAGASWATVAALILGLVATILVSMAEKRHESAKDRKERLEKISVLKRERRRFWASGRLDKVAEINRALRALRGGAALVLLAVVASCAGCAHREPRIPRPAVIGINVFMPKPGEVITVPQLPEGDSVWYLMTDGAADALEIDIDE